MCFHIVSPMKLHFLYNTVHSTVTLKFQKCFFDTLLYLSNTSAHACFSTVYIDESSKKRFGSTNAQCIIFCMEESQECIQYTFTENGCYCNFVRLQKVVPLDHEWW